MHYDILTYDGVSFSDFKCWWDGSKVFSRVGREIEKLAINGRSGDLTISHDRFPNVIISYNCFIKENFRNNYAALLDFLNNQVGYKQLRSTEEPNMYRLALFHANTEPLTTPFNQAGQFTLEFDCDPRLFLDIGNEPINITNNSVLLLNPTYSPAYPLVEITEATGGTIRISFSNGALVEIDASVSNFPFYVDFGEAVQMYYLNSVGEKVEINSSLRSTPYGNPFSLPGKQESIITLTGANGNVRPRWYRL